MRDPCDSCALREGAAANKEPYNALRALICVLSGRPFWCHHGIAWQERDDKLTHQECRTVGTCAGWRREVAKRKARGWFRDVTRARVRAWMGEYLLIVIDKYVAEKDRREKKRLLAVIRDGIQRLGAKEPCEGPGQLQAR